jgi:hypothetical protein
MAQKSLNLETQAKRHGRKSKGVSKIKQGQTRAIGPIKSSKLPYVISDFSVFHT